MEDERCLVAMRIFNFVLDCLTKIIVEKNVNTGFNTFIYEYYTLSLLVRFDVMEFSVGIYYEVRGITKLESYYNIITRSARSLLSSIPSFQNDAFVVSEALVHFKSVFEDLEELFVENTELESLA